MASKTKAMPQKEEAPEKKAPEAPDTPLPLLDLSDAAIKKLIRSAKKRGCVTHNQMNSVLPSEEVNSEQIEHVLATFSEMGINVVETEDTSDEEEQREEPEEETEAESAELIEVRRAVPAKSEPKSDLAPMIPCACICAQWNRSSCFRARAKWPSPSASKPAAKR